MATTLAYGRNTLILSYCRKFKSWVREVIFGADLITGSTKTGGAAGFFAALVFLPPFAGSLAREFEGLSFDDVEVVDCLTEEVRFV